MTQDKCANNTSHIHYPLPLRNRNISLSFSTVVPFLTVSTQATVTPRTSQKTWSQLTIHQADLLERMTAGELKCQNLICLCVKNLCWNVAGQMHTTSHYNAAMSTGTYACFWGTNVDQCWMSRLHVVIRPSEKHSDAKCDQPHNDAEPLPVYDGTHRPRPPIQSKVSKNANAYNEHHNNYPLLCKHGFRK